MDEFAALDALAQAELVAKKAVKPIELLEAAIARAEAANPTLNFLAHKLYDRARKAAGAPLPAGPLAGVPFLVKDLHIDIAGEPSGEGSRLFKGYVPTENSVVYDRFTAAGLNTFGKTTSPEFGLTVTTESTAYGVTRNPWHHGHSAGGSSGGAACAVAAGVVPIAQASDGGGSIRCPAAACGLFGLKPSRGRVPLGPHRTEGWFGLSVVGAVSRSVRDSAAILDAISGPELGSRYTAPTPQATFLSEVTRSPGKLRVALQRTPHSGTPVDPQVLRELDKAAKLLESLGHHVEEAMPSLDAAALGAGMGAMLAVSTRAEVMARLRALGRDSAGDDIENVTQMFVHVGERTTGEQVAAANQAFQDAAIAIARFMTRYDIILSPVFAAPPIEIGKLHLGIDSTQWTQVITAYSPFTGLYNQTGAPAMSLPLGWSDEGLPIGIMAAGRYGEEALLLRLAGQVEAAAPWADKRPPAAA